MAHIGWLLGAMGAASVSAAFLAPAALDAVAAQRQRHRRRLMLSTGRELAQQPPRTRLQAVVAEAVSRIRSLPAARGRAVAVLSRLSFVQRPATSLAALLKRYDIPCDVPTATALLASAEALAVIAALMATHSALVALIVAAAGLALPSHLLRREATRHAAKLREQTPDALRVLDSAVCAGLSLPRAFSYAAACTDDPLGSELGRVEWAIASGQGIDEALCELQERVAVPELVFVTVAMEVQHRSGGSLHTIIGIASDSIREAFDLERSLEVKTAQARLSANVVAAMPAVLLALLVIASPGYLEGFLSHPIGVVMLAAAAVLDLAGLAAIKACMDVEV